MVISSSNSMAQGSKSLSRTACKSECMAPLGPNRAQPLLGLSGRMKFVNKCDVIHLNALTKEIQIDYSHILQYYMSIIHRLLLCSISTIM